MFTCSTPQLYIEACGMIFSSGVKSRSTLTYNTIGITINKQKSCSVKLWPDFSTSQLHLTFPQNSFPWCDYQSANYIALAHTQKANPYDWALISQIDPKVEKDRCISRCATKCPDNTSTKKLASGNKPPVLAADASQLSRSRFYHKLQSTKTESSTFYRPHS